MWVCCVKDRAGKCATKLWSNQAEEIIGVIGYMRHRRPVERGFFDPMAIRAGKAVGFGLVNHTPPMCSADQWKPHHVTSLLTPVAGTTSATVNVATISSWNTMVDPKPLPSVYRGFPPCPSHERTVQLAVERLCGGTVEMPPLVLINPRGEVIPTLECTNTPAENAECAAALALTSASTLLVTSVDPITSTFARYNYVFRIGHSISLVKVLVPWDFPGKLSLRYCVPLHGMGSDDLEWLYGMAGIVIFVVDGNLVAANVSVLRSAMVDFATKAGYCPGEEWSSPPLHITPFMNRPKNMPTLAKNVISAVTTLTAPILSQKEVGVMNAMSQPGSAMDVECLSSITDRISGAVLETTMDDSERHNHDMANCGPQCIGEEKTLVRQEMLNADLYSTEVVFGGDVNRPRTLSEKHEAQNDDDAGVVVSMSDGLAHDVHVMVSPSRLLSICIASNAIVWKSCGAEE